VGRDHPGQIFKHTVLPDKTISPYGFSMKCLIQEKNEHFRGNISFTEAPYRSQTQPCWDVYFQSTTCHVILLYKHGTK